MGPMVTDLLITLPDHDYCPEKELSYTLVCSDQSFCDSAVSFNLNDGSLTITDRIIVNNAESTETETRTSDTSTGEIGVQLTINEVSSEDQTNSSETLEFDILA